jgi:hypothetical protein
MLIASQAGTHSPARKTTRAIYQQTEPEYFGRPVALGCYKAKK